MKVYRDGEVQDFGVLLVRWEANQIIVGARYGMTFQPKAALQL